MIDMDSVIERAIEDAERDRSSRWHRAALWLWTVIVGSLLFSCGGYVGYHAFKFF